MTKKLLEEIEKLAEEKGFDVDEIQDDLKYESKQDCGFVSGYTGCEGEGSDICFICRIKDDYWRVIGDYSSWDGSTIYWNQATYLGKLEEEERTVEVVKKVLVNSKGDVVETVSQKDKESSDSSWED